MVQAKAGDPTRGAAIRNAAIKLVEDAILDVTHKSECRWVAGARGGVTRFQPSTVCGAPAWITASGTRHWRLALAHALPPGRYVFLARSVDFAGHASGGFSIRHRTLAAVTVP
jgi:hypothetical protein